MGKGRAGSRAPKIGIVRAKHLHCLSRIRLEYGSNCASGLDLHVAVARRYSFSVMIRPPSPPENPAQETSGRVPGDWTRVLPLLVLVCAIVYYASYLRCWFNPHDEGGTAVLLASRLLHGERPFVDVQLGYNVGWFYPLVGLFKIFGPHYLITRGWFFFLSTLAALAAFRLVRLATGSPWMAFLVGLILVVFPGSQFKNYIPLLAVLNTCVLVQTMLRQERSERCFAIDMCWAGIVLGLTFLIRIDLGCLFTLLWLGALLWLWADAYVGLLGKLVRTCLALILPAMILLLHAPIYFDAQARGFDRPFLAQYAGWIDLLSSNSRKAIGLAEQARPVEGKIVRSGAPAVRTTLPRAPLTALWTGADLQDRALAFLIYAPLVGYAGFLIWIGTQLFGALRQRAFATSHLSFITLLALGGALAVFPQFFFFRPDRPHLSEFMPLYIVACVIGLWAMWRVRGGGRAKSARLVFTVFIVGQISLFAWFALQHPSAGTIAARSKRTIPFHGANGVDVLVQKKEFEFLDGVRKIVVACSNPGEFLICYPYQPGFNVMTDRPTYLHNVYVDNATQFDLQNVSGDNVAQPRSWARATIAELESRRPAVIIIDDRAINKVDASRFSIWAAPVYEYIRAQYHRRDADHFSGVEIYSASAPTDAPPP